ncbi:MAG TPA: DNA polymerase III subunit delta [Ktedonobacterales bacterium]|nr:DNA polymerase III subunit delta [Ktedonobacterales bacterium]
MFYLFHGKDEFSMREELARLRAAGGFEHNQDAFAGEDADLAAITVTCATLPFLSARRLVVVEGLPKRRRASKPPDAERDDGPDARRADAEAAPAPRTRSKRGAGAPLEAKAFAQGLADLAARLPETTLLVVLVDDDVEAASPLVAAATRHGAARHFPEPKGNQLEGWLMQRAETLGARLAPDAARALAAAAGPQLRPLASELEKLATYVGREGAITAADVQLLTAATQPANRFELTDALARKDRTRALALVHEQLAAGESALAIIGQIAYQTRTLIQVKALAERGLRGGQIAQTVGMSPFIVEKSVALARQFTFAQLVAAHRALLEMDAALKLSRMTPELALDLLVVEFGR